MKVADHIFQYGFSGEILKRQHNAHVIDIMIDLMRDKPNNKELKDKYFEPIYWHVAKTDAKYYA